MTTLLLQAADKAAGTLAGAAASGLGGAVSALLSGGRGSEAIRFAEGPRLGEMQGLASRDGAPIPRLYGRARLGGQLIWATRFEEVVATSVAVERPRGRAGGKSLGAAPRQTTVSTGYSYYANLAIGLCEGPIALVRRVWADGREVDLTTFTMRVHAGGEDQTPDPLVVAKEGAGNVPAYRGLAYVVFERLPLAPYGNRVPQFSFEVVRPVGTLAPAIRSVCLIPGATEFGYDPAPVARVLGLGRSVPENVHQLGHASDVLASLDALQGLCPNLEHVALVASWFGTDLRAGRCTIEPRVDLAAKTTSGAQWAVAGLTRAGARETSRAGGSAAYGGTPSDDGLIRLIGELKRRGLAVSLYPFVMMDVPPGNGLPDPRRESGEQPAYPWRGRITCDPAPGLPDTPDASPAAEAEVAAFFGRAVAADFTFSGGGIRYAGPPEWSFRRHILHYAALARAAGGVEGFVIGSELVGLTRIRSGSGVYPATAQLRALAAEARALLGAPTKLVYAADWTEYGAHVLADGDEIRFPLDPLFADPNIHAVGIDYYPPITDRRDGGSDLDAQVSPTGTDLGHLRERLASGEAFDWYYADAADREAQQRSPIADGAYGKPWIFRPKDLVGWWSSLHVERVGGIEIGPTAWVPGSKPIWLTEIGIPAVDKGANSPNLFPDPKSSEGGLPPFSSGARDDLIQARGLEAILSRFDPALPGHAVGMNPAARAYAGRMVEPSRISLWCWDARPYPSFPDFRDVWTDGVNWSIGHWLNGRLEGASLGALVAAILEDAGLDGGGAEGLDGYVIDRPLSARAALEPLVSLHGVSASVSGGRIVWGGGTARRPVPIRAEDLAQEGEEPVLALGRLQETDLPAAIELGFTDASGEYRSAVARSRALVGTSRRELAIDTALVIRAGEARRLADARLRATWAERETARFTLSPRAVAIEPGDVVSISGSPTSYRVERIADGAARRIEAVALGPPPGPPSAPEPEGHASRRPALAVGPPAVVVLDLPASGTSPETLQHIAIAAAPWPGAIAIRRLLADGGSVLHRLVEVPSVIGRTLSAFPPGPVWRWDHGSRLEVELSGGSLSSLSEEEALAGGNLFALLGPDGGAEIVGARDAELIGERRYRLSRLLRGLGGTEHLAMRSLASGMTLVLLDGTAAPLSSDLAEIGRSYRYLIGPAGRAADASSHVMIEATVGAQALLPLAPVHLSARRVPGGIAIGWIRRARLDGDGWALADVPLGEEVEAYELDIMSGGERLRTIATPIPTALYDTASERADFGAPQARLDLRVSQLGRTTGRGREAAASVPVL